MTLSKLNNGLSAWNLFDDHFFNEDWSHWRRNILPHNEDENGYNYFLNLAGFKRENIKVNVENDTLNIEAKQGDKKLNENFWIPEDADVKASVARYEDGILYIKLNKKESSKPLNIEVK